MVIEVIACTVADAIEAEKGGAGRLELVRELAEEGFTPPLALVEDVVARVSIPVRVMIREQTGFAAGDARSVDRLVTLAAERAALGIDGVVLGFLRGRQIDVAAMDAVLAAVRPKRATFHRAFEELPDPAAALAALARWPQIDRILTTGGRGEWTARAARLASLATAAGNRIGILAGGGVDEQAIDVLMKAGIHEVHTGRAVREPAVVDGAVSAHKVARLVSAQARGT